MKNTLLLCIGILFCVNGILYGMIGETDKSVKKNVPKYDIIVAADGSGDFRTLQAAIDAAPSQSDKRFIIYLRNGIYDREKLIIPADKKNITLVGEDRQKTVISYHIYDCKSPESGNKRPVESWALWKDQIELIRTSATLTILGEGCRLENLTVENTAGPVGQALALTLRADRLLFRNCDILGYQDTIFIAEDGKLNYFENCLILGRTDYIYGGGIAYFQGCEIRSWGGGWITAPSTPKDQRYGFVFNQCDFTYLHNSPRKGDDGQPIAIGRPWHHYPKVTILNSNLCEQMHPAGWPTKWHMDYAPESADLHLYEFNNTGLGADMKGRADWVGIRQLTTESAKEYTRDRVLGNILDWK